jgi:V-type H+-transporting ATPase proteolipid subunit
MGVMRPELIMKCIVPVVMAGIVGIYGVVVSLFLIGRFKQDGYSLYTYLILLVIFMDEDLQFLFIKF